ncbi:MAG: murein transglycosylase A [Saprospiraceae bacterium]
MLLRKKHLFIVLFSCFIILCISIGSCKDGENIELDREELIEKVGVISKSLDGKMPHNFFDSILTKISLDTFDSLPPINQELAEGLKHQLKLLKYQKGLKEEYSGLKITKEQLNETIKILLSAQFNNSFGMLQSLEAHQIWGEDQRGNVKFTGYFTPVLKVRKRPNSHYKYPIYQYPKKWKGRLPSRKAIEGEGALDSFNLEIAYAKSKLDIYFMQVQGSGYIEFPNGERKLLAHEGTNKHPYRSIGKYMVKNGFTTPEYVSLKSIKSYFRKNPDLVDSILFQNPSYVFFRPVTTQPRGAGHVPLTPNYSIAIDRKILPLGSCLLATVPILDANRNFSHHEFRILIAQDIGGVIKGEGHIDLYKGIGAQAEIEASNLHQYGHLWLLLPKDSTKLIQKLDI